MDIGPEYGGANFVDADLKVKVVAAEATLIAHRPEHRHGTTTSCGWVNAGFSLAFSKHIFDAWKIAEQGKQEVTGGEGVGQ